MAVCAVLCRRVAFLQCGCVPSPAFVLLCSNERVQYTRLPTTEPEGTDDKEGQGEEKEEQKGALDRDEDMLNPVV